MTDDTDPMDWAGDWHLPGLGQIMRADIDRYILARVAERKERERRDAWRVEHGYAVGGHEIKPGVEYRFKMEHCRHADCPDIREGMEHAHTLAERS